MNGSWRTWRTIVFTVIGSVLVIAILVASTLWAQTRFNQDHDRGQKAESSITHSSQHDDAVTGVHDNTTSPDGQSSALTSTSELCATTAKDAVNAFLSDDHARINALFASNAEGLDDTPNRHSTTITDTWTIHTGEDMASCMARTDDATWVLTMRTINGAWKVTAINSYSGTMSAPSGVKETSR